MRLYEDESKRLFATQGIPVPQQLGVVTNPDELETLLDQDLPWPIMLKARVLTGGRGKAGGIKKAADADEARTLLPGLLGLQIKDQVVNAVSIEAAADLQAEAYAGITTNPLDFDVVLMVSPKGGMDIEQVALDDPAAIKRFPLPENPAELPAEVAKEAAAFLAAGMDGGEDHEVALRDILTRLYACYYQSDAKTAEVNPLALTPDGPLAADAKVVLDDNGLYRQGDLLRDLGITTARHDVAERTRNEIRADKGGFIYVDLLPEGAEKDPEKLYVGLHPGGAGYGIFSIDEVANIGDRYFDGKVVPLNFMDSGGGPPVEGVAEMFHLLQDHPLIDIVISSRFGGISSCDIYIRGLVRCLRERHADGRRVVPVYGRMVGTDLPAARTYLDQAVVETPAALAPMHIEVGNRRIMAEVIRDAIAKTLVDREAPAAGSTDSAPGGGA